jgi:hypothetical protein
MVENLRRSLASLKVPEMEAVPTLTVGVAEAIMNTAFAPEDVVTEVINRAEDALRVARENSGDQTQVITPEMLARVARA